MKAKIIFLSFIASLLFSGCNLFKNHKNYIAPIKIHKLPVLQYTIKEKNATSIALNIPNLEYFKILDLYDGRLFKKVGKKIVFTFTPNFNDPKDENKDNIYKVKLYIVTKEQKDYFTLVQIKITKANTPIIVDDKDGDFIPDNIEKLLNLDPNNADSNNNGIKDGLEGDSFFDKEWFIYSQEIPMNPSNIAPIKGNDLHLLPVYHKYMGYNNGNPIIIQIVDSGIEANHEDLKDNFDLSHSLDGAEQGKPTPGGFFKPHGTMLAGIAAARAFNNKGVRGVAPFAKIACSNFLAKQSLDALEAAWYSGPGANEIAVSNNSWGRYFTADTIYEDIMEAAVSELRDGKGRVFVFASGNAREENADANIQYMINNRFGIVVGALNYDNKVAPYSTPGANLWISAYGGAKNVNDGPTIATTYLSGKSQETWDSDSKKNYTYAMAGSSAAAPMVSGEVALLLEACPSLTYRDVKYILAKTAIQIDKSNPSWIENGAGYHFSRDYGFGLINLDGAIKFCQNNYHNLPKEETTQSQKSFQSDIQTSKSFFFLDINQNIKIEWVEATIDINSTNASNLDIFLTSPSGTRVKILQSGTKIGERYIPVANWMQGGFRFSTGAMLDEESVGTWQIEIVKKDLQTKAVLNSIKLKIYGHKE